MSQHSEVKDLKHEIRHDATEAITIAMPLDAKHKGTYDWYVVFFDIHPLPLTRSEE